MIWALAEEHRWVIVCTLLAEPLSASNLSKRLGMTQPSIAKHLRILRDAGIVVPEHTGKEVRACIATAFREELSRSKNRLVVGCCAFDFNLARP